MPGLTHFPSCSECGRKNGHYEECSKFNVNPWTQAEVLFLTQLLAELSIVNDARVFNMVCERIQKLQRFGRLKETLENESVYGEDYHPSLFER
jgi:hypothetical protein